MIPAIAAGLLLLVGGGAWLAMGRGGVSPTTPVEPSAPTDPGLAVVEPPPSAPVEPGAPTATGEGTSPWALGAEALPPPEDELAEPPPPPEVGAPPAPTTVPVHVETVPAGATVVLSGGLEGCSPTPCDFDAPRGEAIEVRARRGRMEGTTEVTPTGETTIQIALAARRSSRSRTRSTRMTSSDAQTGTTMRATDLKIPDIFR